MARYYFGWQAPHRIDWSITVRDTAAPAESSARNDDAPLITAMMHGDTAAMSQLYDRYSARVLGLALRITRERADAEEVLVDTFAQAWRDAARFQTQRGSVAAWLATIARTRALDLLRSRSRRHRLDDAASELGHAEPPAYGSASASPVAAVIADEQSRRVQQALAELAPTQRDALELAYFGGLSQSEIAARLNEPLGTVKTRMRLGLRRLRELLAPLAPGDAA